MKFPALLALTLLVACGAAGAPEPPAKEKPAKGVTVTGEARVGVTGTM